MHGPFIGIAAKLVSSLVPQPLAASDKQPNDYSGARTLQSTSQQEVRDILRKSQLLSSTRLQVAPGEVPRL
jgi:hypothetical protein